MQLDKYSIGGGVMYTKSKNVYTPDVCNYTGQKLLLDNLTYNWGGFLKNMWLFVLFRVVGWAGEAHSNLGGWGQAGRGVN
jgi:hypothetical protein